MAAIQLVRGGSGRGAAKSRYGFDFQVNKKQIDSVVRKLDSVKDKPMAVRVEKALWSQGDLLAARMKQAAPRSTGNLRASISARRRRRGKVEQAIFKGATLGEILVGPEARKAPHRHLVILGTGYRPSVSKRGRPSSPYRAFGGHVFRREQMPYVGRMTPNPFVDRVASRAGVTVRRAVEKAWFKTI